RAASRPARTRWTRASRRETAASDGRSPDRPSGRAAAGREAPRPGGADRAGTARAPPGRRTASRGLRFAEEAPAQHLQRELGREAAHTVSIAGQTQLAMVDVVLTGTGHGDMYRADRLLRAAAARSGDARDADPIVAAQGAADAFGHGARHRLGNRAVLGEQLRRHADHPDLQLVAVGDRAAEEIVAAAGNTGDALREEAASARFGGGER